MKKLAVAVAAALALTACTATSSPDSDNEALCAVVAEIYAWDVESGEKMDRVMSGLETPEDLADPARFLGLQEWNDTFGDEVKYADLYNRAIEASSDDVLNTQLAEMRDGTIVLATVIEESIAESNNLEEWVTAFTPLLEAESESMLRTASATLDASETTLELCGLPLGVEAGTELGYEAPSE